jgi:hypothetical protein
MTNETKDIKAKSQPNSDSATDVSSQPNESQNTRRRFIQAGVIGLPIILTLKSRAAWGQGGYEGWESKWESMKLGTSLDHTDQIPPGERKW